MATQYTKAELIKMYRSYAREVGWIDHPIAAAERSDLYLAGGCESMEVAIAHFEKAGRSNRQKRFKSARYVLAGMSLIIGSIYLIHR